MYYFLNIFIPSLILINLKLILGSEDWGYEEHNGPHTWEKLCKEGKKQSPIDIRKKNLKLSCIDKLGFVNYNNSGDVEIKNNGHGGE